ncbi:ECF transporter S component [Apilactobacillus timberlakei]|uniref:ECF transporter S component n=1 Tax=Apilactobacillus timberlakei TaxID=2008380 RepID=UPI001129EC2F|nr:ECF transporter S component [Apilactobacillus timberlakei]TPR25167.1 ECF transporter S component [Apilactobacillus timberlakei]
MFIAIILIQTTIPGIGNIPIGPLSITIIPITIIVASILLGSKNGAILGGVWGIITFIRAFWWPTSPLAVFVLINPIISVLPRMLVGLVSGLFYHKLVKYKINNKLLMSLSGIIGSLINTVLVLFLIYIFYKNDSFNIYHINTNELLPYLLGIAGTNGLIEAILSGIFVPIIAVPLQKIKK